jgi:hypothetical protein
MSDRFVGAQVGAISFIDEGVERTLETLAERGAVNAVCVSALSWARGNAGRALFSFPDHGVAEPDNLQGGAFFRPDARYYEGTSLKHFTAPDALYTGFDALGDVTGPAHAVGMKVYPYYCETSHVTPRPLWQPGFSRVLEIDVYGRKASRPCLRHPDYLAWWFGVIENWFNEYELDGIMWGIERQGPLQAMLEGEAATCFCIHCRQEAARRNVDAARVSAGYRTLDTFFGQARAGERPLDGYFITFLRILFDYPEILQWEKLWVDAHKALYREIFGQVKFYGSQYEVGLGVWQMIDTFNPFLRAQHDPAEYRLYADWLKPVLYNVPAGARFQGFVQRLCSTILGDATPAEWTPILYKILGLDEAAYDDLPMSGFRPEYVKEQTARFVAAAGPRVKLYPGIGIGVQDAGGTRPVSPSDVSSAIEAAVAGGASGVMLSRNYSEMALENLSAAGDTIRRLNVAG